MSDMGRSTYHLPASAIRLLRGKRTSVAGILRVGLHFDSNQLVNPFMQFDTKIAVVIRTDLEAWQKLNIASFLAGGIAASFPECIGENYEDGSGTKYLSLIAQPLLIYGADLAALSRALERALARNVK